MTPWPWGFSVAACLLANTAHKLHLLAHFPVLRRDNFLALVAAVPLIQPLAMLFTVTDHDRVVTCYISTWAVYRTGSASYPLDAFDPTLCTHAIYAFAGLDEEKNAIKSLGKFAKGF